MPPDDPLSDVPSNAPWLAGVPQITDDQRDLAERDAMPRRQERRLRRAVNRIKRKVRQAAAAWHREIG
jgi:hypothetical protein